MTMKKEGLGTFQSAAGGVMADQWKEYFYCEAMPANILATKGHKKVTGRSSNYKGDENIITNGSMIAVADGQCMLIVEQGKVVEVCAEPGEFLYDSSTEPSIFSGQARRRHRRRFSATSASVSPSAAKRRRTSASTTSTPRSSSAISTARRPRSVPRRGSARGDRHRRGHPLLRRVQLSYRQPAPVLHERLRQRERGL